MSVVRNNITSDDLFDSAQPFKTTRHNYNCRRKTSYRHGQLNTNERNVA